MLERQIETMTAELQLLRTNARETVTGAPDIGVQAGRPLHRDGGDVCLRAAGLEMDDPASALIDPAAAGTAPALIEPAAGTASDLVPNSTMDPGGREEERQEDGSSLMLAEAVERANRTGESLAELQAQVRYRVAIRTEVLAALHGLPEFSV